MRRSIAIMVTFVLANTAMAAAPNPSDPDLILQAVAPLPVELRDGAEVFTYDKRWQRRVLRSGTNTLRCHAPGSVSLSVNLNAQCFHQSWEASMVRMTRALSDGMAVDEAFSTLVAEMRAGKIAAPKAGSALFELFSEEGLQGHANMAIATPNATQDAIGVSTIRSAYRPWLMLPGTPMAHVMIPGK